eukprot:2179808-Pyramimonas_sp.AAC.1
MLAWTKECTLNLDRLDFELTMRVPAAFQHRKVHMLAWELECNLNGDRCDFEVDMRFLYVFKTIHRNPYELPYGCPEESDACHNKSYGLLQESGELPESRPIQFP